MHISKLALPLLPGRGRGWLLALGLAMLGASPTVLGAMDPPEAAAAEAFNLQEAPQFRTMLIGFLHDSILDALGEATKAGREVQLGRPGAAGRLAAATAKVASLRELLAHAKEMNKEVQAVEPAATADEKEDCLT